MKIKEVLLYLNVFKMKYANIYIKLKFNNNTSLSFNLK